MSYRQPEDVYTYRRNDGSSRRDYGERSGLSGSNRSYDDYNDRRNQQAHRDNDFPEQRRRRASMTDPSTSAGLRPQVNRNPSFEGVARNTYTESPLRSPVSAVSSIQSSTRTNDARVATGLKADSDTSKASGVVTDPRLKKRRSLSIPAPAFTTSTSDEMATTPVSPNMNVDGGNDLPHAGGSEKSPTSPDEVMTDATTTDGNSDTRLVEALVRFIEPAVASGIQQQRLNTIKHELKKAKEEKDKVAKQPKLPPVVLEGHKVKHDQAAKSYKVVSKDLQDAYATRSSSATELVNQIAALISHTSLQHYQETQSKQANETDSWRKDLIERIEVLGKELTMLRATDDNVERIKAMEQKQSELESLIKKAQPQFEKNIDFLMDKHKVQQNDFSKLRNESTSLRDRQNNQESDFSKLRDDNASLHKMQDQQQSDISKLLSENNSLRSETRMLRKEMQDMRESSKIQLKKYVSFGEFDGFKAMFEANRPQNQEVPVLRSNIDAEMKALGAQIVDVKQTLEHKLTQHVLKSEFNSFKAESNTPSTTSVSRQQENDANMSYEDANVQVGLSRLKEGVDLIGNKATGFAAARQSAFEAMKGLEQLQQRLDYLQKDSAKSKSQMNTVNRSNPPSPQHASLVDTENEIRNLWAEVSSLETRERSMQAQIGQIQTAATVSVSSSTNKTLSSAESHAMANRIDILSGQIENIKSELHRLRERQTQSPPSDTSTTSPSNNEGRMQNVERWTEAHKALIGTISANMVDGKTAVEKKIAEVENSIWNVTQNLRVLQTRVDKHQSTTATKQDVANVSSQLNQLSARPPSLPTPEAPSALSAKERMLLDTLEFVPKRLNNLENTVSEIVKNEGQVPTQPPLEPPSEFLKEYDARLAATNTILNQVKDEVKQKVDGWEEGLRQVSGNTHDRISNLHQSMEMMRTDLKASEHSLRSLTSRYNNLTSEGMARKIADIVQPLPAQLQREQTNLKAALGEVESRADKLNKSFETLSEAVTNGQFFDATIEKARELFAEVKDLDELHKTFLSMTTRVSNLENAGPSTNPDEELGEKVTDLLSQFEKGRDDLRTNHDELKKRVQKLEGRAAKVNDWAQTNEERQAQGTSKESENSPQDDSNSLLSSFKPRYAPAPTNTVRPASRSSASSDSARGSPSVQYPSQSSTQESVPFASRLPQESTHPTPSPLRSLTSRIEPPRPLADRIESPRVATKSSTPQKRQHAISDGEEGANDDTVTVQTPGRGDGGRKKGKKYPRFQ